MQDSPLYQHQQDAVDFLIKKHGNGALFMDCGTGKTRVAIEAFRCLRKQVPKLKLLVICPVSLIQGAWIPDIERFSDFTYNNLRKDIEDIGKADISLINFESFITKSRFYKILSHVTNNDTMVVVDESSRMKSYKSITTKRLHELRPAAKYRVVMSGTPAPNTPLEYWGQMEFIQRGLLHPVFFGYRNSYFHLQRGKQIMNVQRGTVVSRQMMGEILRSGWAYQITKDNLIRLTDRMAPYIFRADKDKCLDLPDTVDEIRAIELTAPQRKLYNDMKRHLIIELKDVTITAPVALTKVMKLREITSGFVYDENHKAHSLDQNPKLKELSCILEEIGNRPCIIWCQFIWEIKAIKDLLGEDRVACMTGTQREKDAAIVDFKAGRARYLIAHPKSAAHGLTFTDCSYQVFFSLAFSWEDYIQSKNRIHRIGQASKCTYIHLLASDTIDESIMKALHGKRDMNEVVYDMLR